MNKIRTAIYYLVAIPALLAIVLISLALSGATLPIWFRSNQDEPIEFAVDRGKSFGATTTKLNQSGYRAPPSALRVYGRLAGIDRQVQPGRYRMDPGSSAIQALEQVALGTNSPSKATVLPGTTLVDLARALALAGWVDSASDWIEQATGETAVSIAGKPSLEGLFRPETYFFEGPEPPSDVIQTLSGDWKSYLTEVAGSDDLDERMRNGITLYDNLILASVIEKEAAKRVEMATVSSVFHNRLRKGWPMGSAATLRYAIDDWTRPDRELPVRLKSPYNTSKKPGLPPTPICVPSKNALEAALHPVETDYMFFVADGEGGLIFNETLKGHNRSVRDYRKRQREKQ